MSLLSVLLNVLWILTGGLWMAVAWLVAAVLMAITLVGLPWVRAAFTIARYTFLPFGRVAWPRDEVEAQEDLGTGPLGTIGNVLWLVLAGWWLALGHDHGHRSCHYNHWYSLRLGAPQAGCAFAVAGWQDHRDHRRGGNPSKQNIAALDRASQSVLMLTRCGSHSLGIVRVTSSSCIAFGCRPSRIAS
jgi:Inner membrane component domain